ncbi:uncharacterized protein PV09_08001 [Verruconis gallopava]|uniref:Uncharacterized protein n=1 Tax=Verruconis gallopava TaxID=253628 RepID=A0A0D2A1E2_9PEZI|nr:uncharacterized protein PV09_08001 [Verruconis gallopava]KIW00478.1 hypothetical protein PV09_08001 [Verruconis gallopava]
MDPHPKVFHPIELAPFVEYALYRICAPLHLIICSSQEIFLKELCASMQFAKDAAIAESEAIGVGELGIRRLSTKNHDLLAPTLRQLASSVHINVTFCSTLPQLRAYLSTYHASDHFQTGGDSGITPQKWPVMALINPIALHRGTLDFSAQGLGRTLASAVEAAARTKAKLVVVECPPRANSSERNTGAMLDDDETPMPFLGHDTGMQSEAAHQDLWDEEVSILNISTSTFGAGARGWAGRTVKIKAVAERWFTFDNPAS